MKRALALVCGCAVLAACHEVRLRHSERAVVELISAPETENAVPRTMTITEADYRRELARVRVEREGGLTAAPLSLELKQAILNRMIDRRLLSMEAEKLNVHASTVAVANEVNAMRKSLPPKDFEKRLIDTYQTERELAATIDEILTAGKLLEQQAFSSLKVSEDDVRKRWDSRPEVEKMHPARVHAAQIVLRTEEEGQAVVQQLKKGADFAEMARKKSAAPEAVRGGDLGWFEAGVMPLVFDEVCFSMKPGEISELTASEYGFHIFKLLEAESERPLAYEEARPELLRQLREEAAREAETKYMEELRQKVQIVKNHPLIASIE
jgi:parvulin-like peptidyl-prolyl isomerase